MILVASLEIPGEPRSKQRPRVTRTHAYTPKITRDYENSIRAAWDAELRPDQPACVHLQVTFYLGTHRHVDLDNLVKATKDALNGRAYDDDWRVHELTAFKRYTDRDHARTVIDVYSINPDREEAI